MRPFLSQTIGPPRPCGGVTHVDQIVVPLLHQLAEDDKKTARFIEMAGATEDTVHEAAKAARLPSLRNIRV